MKKLLKLFESLERRRPVGTLVLGRRGHGCELFIEEDRVYYAGREYSGKVDIEGLLKSGLLGQKISPGVLEAMIANSNLCLKPLPEILFQQGLLSAEERLALLEGNLQEEIFSRALHQGDSFGFQEEQVPLHLLGDDPRKAPVLLKDVIEMLRTRSDALAAIEALIPSRKEIPVVTEKGMARQSVSEGDYAERHLFSLIDGFRDLSQIIRDVAFYEFFVLSRIATAIQEGHLKKTVLPEIRDLNIGAVPREELERLLPAFKAAVKHAVDEIAVRERLAVVYERLGQADEAVIQYNFIGDALYRMKKTPKALKAFQRALELHPANTLVADKVVKIHQEAAAEALASGRREEALELLTDALVIRPDSQEILDRLLELHIASSGIRALADLCDREVARSRALRDIGPALRILRTVLEQFPEEPLFRKKAVNLYIDFGMDMEAVAELEFLAAREVRLGQGARAQEIFEKIIRIDPGREDIRRQLKRMERRAAVRRLPGKRVSLGKLCLILFVAAGMYQVWTYFAFQSLRGKGSVWSSSAPREPQGVARSPEEKRLEEMSAQVDRFLRHYPLSAFGPEAHKLAETWHVEAIHLATQREKHKEEILSHAKRLQGEGWLQAAADVAKSLLAAEAGDPRRREAEEIIGKVDAYEKTSSDLRAKAETDLSAGDWIGAYGLLKQVIHDFPLSKAATGMELPVEIHTVPENVGLRLEGEDIGEAPRRIRLRTGKPPILEAEQTGFERLKEPVPHDGGPVRLYILNRKPAWTASLGSPVRFGPVISKDFVLVVLENGALTARSREDGSQRWTQSCGNVVMPIAAPLETGGRILLALNDGQILSFSRSGELEQRMKPQGLISSPLASLEGGSVLYGTTNGTLAIWRPLEGISSIPLPVRSAPVRIRAIRPERVFLCTEKGKVVLVDSAAGRIVWETSLEEKAATAPSEAGGAVIVETLDKKLLAIDGRTGAILWRRTLPPPQAAAILEEDKRVVIAEDDPSGGTDLVEIDPLSGKEAARSALASRITSLKAFQRSLSAVTTGGVVLFLDVPGLKPLWGWKPAKGRATSWTGDGDRVFLATDSGEITAFPQETPGTAK